jgi:valyl-tRNA synthetase
MELSSKYNPQTIEDKWYENWLKNNYFHATPDNRPAYSIVIPPPNVTGVLHMGHMLNNTIQDILARYNRMLGKNVCWVPGTDHASIATEAKVVNHLKEQGIDKNTLSRDEFLEHAWQWKEKHGGIILEQLKKLGASCDWERTRFTMDEDLSKSVLKVFIDLYNKGLIYRGTRMINWDCKAKTALSDEEVIHKDVKGKLYFVNYQIAGSDEFLTIATTRPETILGDSAICVNPNDTRYQHLKNKKAIVPLVNREVPIIFDDYVDMEFGTGALKITPAHDVNDYNLYEKYKADYPEFEFINIFNDDGTLNEQAGDEFKDIDRFEAQKLIAQKLDALGILVKVEDYTHSVGFSERTDVVVEPRFSQQWFLKVDKLAKPALDNVMNDTIHFYPEKFKNTYRHWMETIHDWCISRQLWWGHRIPAYYIDNNPSLGIFVASSKDEALAQAKEKYPDLTPDRLQQDEDVLDTWFSSWLWPMSVFNGILEPENPDFKYFYPTNDLVTAPEILFFWVARMIMAGYEFTGKKPFENVYLTGIVRDKKRRKMPKSLGNSPDPIELMQQYGADGVRIGMLLTSPAGNDLLFDESLVEQGRNFSNKIWNAFRLLKSWETDASKPQPAYASQAVRWFENRIVEVTKEIRHNLGKYRISDALMSNYTLFWDDFASWYLEIVKPPYGESIDEKTYNETVSIFNKLLKLLHPFMPFITEELWHDLNEKPENDTIMFEAYPESDEIDQTISDTFIHAKDLINKLRNIRQQHQISPKEPLLLYAESASFLDNYRQLILKLGNISAIKPVAEKSENTVSFLVSTTECFVEINKTIDRDKEIKALEEELKYQEGFLKSVSKKLSNDRFVANAPKNVVEKEQQKQADAKSKIATLKEQLTTLKKEV